MISVALRDGVRIARSLCAAAVLALAPPTIALAQPDSPPPPLLEALTGAAKDDYAAARLLYDNGDFSGALVKFLSAYASSRDPRLLWDAGACEKSLGRYAKAATLVRQYVDAGSPLVTADAAAEARALLTAIEPFTARMAIVSNEAGASVSVDGEPVGTTPLADEVVVDLGSRQVTVTKPGFRDFATTITIAGKQVVRIEAQLTKIEHHGHVHVRAGPQDVIALDGGAVGVGEWEGDVPSGGHLLRVTAPDMLPYQSEVVLLDDQVRTVDVKLEPRPHTGVPTWVWIVGGVALAAGGAATAYVLLKPSDRQQSPVYGTIMPGAVQLP